MSKKILLVEDSFLDAELTTHALGHCGVTAPVVHANDGGVALWHLAVDQDIALVLLDLHLRVVSGFEFLTMLRSSPDHLHVPVVILSGSEDPGDRERAANMGTSGYVLKDRDLHSFSATLCDALTPFQNQLGW